MFTGSGPLNQDRKDQNTSHRDSGAFIASIRDERIDRDHRARKKLCGCSLCANLISSKGGGSLFQAG